MSNWYNDEIVFPVQERLDRISKLSPPDSEVQVLIHEINAILDSSGTEHPDHLAEVGQ
ncbi:TPA: hypothetical protein HA338_06280 [Methanosarcina acetivorans]|uniref:Uncharacterized protein n=1 Tax=Methanosarcina acetivorans TaxID=2214 RepID=A0A832VYA2_9EURY|nr:hypothetical protein [Methanosarcina acetivorans]HIH93647.1 hypothetical protein [Methanosarcina acetivorans]